MDHLKTISDFAKENRRNPTVAEEILWQRLRNRKLLGLKFRRQVVIHDLFILDFYCHALKLGIEVDGFYHNDPEQQTLDESRSAELFRLGIPILRFTNDQVIDDIEDVLLSIKSQIKTINQLRLNGKEE